MLAGGVIETIEWQLPSDSLAAGNPNAAAEVT
jgi:hypothetical protein